MSTSRSPDEKKEVESSELNSSKPANMSDDVENGDSQTGRNVENDKKRPPPNERPLQEGGAESPKKQRTNEVKPASSQLMKVVLPASFFRMHQARPLARPTKPPVVPQVKTGQSPSSIILVTNDNTEYDSGLMERNTKLKKKILNAHNFPKEQKSQSYVYMEAQFKAFSEIAMIIAPISLRKNKTDYELYCLSYGLCLMDALMKDAKRSFSDKPVREKDNWNYEKTIEIIGENYGFPAGSLLDAINMIGKIRVILADHFIRMNPKKHDLFSLAYDLMRLVVFSPNFNLDEDIDTLRCFQLQIFAAHHDSIKETTVDNMDRYAYIVSCLQRADYIKCQLSQQIEKGDEKIKIFALGMLYTIAGTCARDLKGQFDLSGDFLKAFQRIREIRDSLAHFNITATGLKNMEKRINEIDKRHLIGFLEVKSEVEKTLGKMYISKDLFRPIPANDSLQVESKIEAQNRINRHTSG